MLKIMKMALAAAVVAGGMAGATTAEAGDFCHGFGYGHIAYAPIDCAPVYVAPVCAYKVFYYDHCGHCCHYGTYHTLHTARLFAHRLDYLGYHTVIRTIH